jgi:hypothetical protein
VEYVIIIEAVPKLEVLEQPLLYRFILAINLFGFADGF